MFTQLNVTISKVATIASQQPPRHHHHHQQQLHHCHYQSQTFVPAPITTAPKLLDKHTHYPGHDTRCTRPKNAPVRPPLPPQMHLSTTQNPCKHSSRTCTAFTSVCRYVPVAASISPYFQCGFFLPFFAHAGGAFVEVPGIFISRDPKVFAAVFLG